MTILVSRKPADPSRTPERDALWPFTKYETYLLSCFAGLWLAITLLLLVLVGGAQ